MLTLSFVYAQDLKISPIHVNFTGSINERICEEVEVVSLSHLIFSNLWSLNETKQLKDYTLLSEKLGLSVYYTGFEDNKTTICLRSSKPGKFYGAFLFRIENSSIGIGTWASVYILGEHSIGDDSRSIQDNSAFRLTGDVIGNNSSNNLFLILGILPTLLLSLFLIYLLKKLKE